MAKRVKVAVESLSDIPLEVIIWNADALPPGQTLIESIESIPFEYDAAVLLWTPDVSSKRDGYGAVRGPVANIVFEYGYLAARLSRKRVAICRFEKADIPSDLKGMKLIEFSQYVKTNPSPLPESECRELREWLIQLPQLTFGLPPISQVHGYSGLWKVQNRFLIWRGYPVEKGNQIYFDGKTSLIIKPDGSAGSGIQVGQLYIFVENYAATYEILNEILQATVDQNGTLKLRAKVIRRKLIDEQGAPPNARFRSELANKEFDLLLDPRTETPIGLDGRHEYKRAMNDFQLAEESYGYQGLFNPSSL